MKLSAIVVLIFLLLAALPVRAGMNGTYTIGRIGTIPGGGDPDFQSLKAACDTLNAHTGAITGDCTFSITSSLVEPASAALGLNTCGYTITFKPAPGVSPVVTFTDTSDHVGISGAWVIGASDLSRANGVTTNKIVIDGSNLPDGVTRDMTIATAAGCGAMTVPLRFYGDVNNSTVKHCVIRTGQPTECAVLLTVRRAGGINYVPDAVTVENCFIDNTAGPEGQAIAVSNSGTPTLYPSGIVLRNNVIEAARTGILLKYAGNTEISGNEFRIGRTGANTMCYGIHCAVIGSSSNVTEIFGNRFTHLALGRTAPDSDGAVTGIQCGSKGTYRVYNNMIAGFSVAGPSASLHVTGIRVGANATVAFNSMYMDRLAIEADAPVVYSGIWIAGGSAVVGNNIVCSHEEMNVSCCIRYTAGVLTADYNDYYCSGPKGCTGSWRGIPQVNLREWQKASGQDVHSRYANPAAAFGSAGNWMNRRDLHWNRAPSPQFAGSAIAGITQDIDGDERHPVPTIGADESEIPLPDELASFTAECSDSMVVLRWTTASELNIYGFEIERCALKECSQKEEGVGGWVTVGFVPGHGTTNLPHFYEYAEKGSGGERFRLKLVDREGGFRYSADIEAMEAAGASYTLEENYPNPFNPETEMIYTIPSRERVHLAVYDAGGRSVATLVDTLRGPGTYSVRWNAQKEPAGIYFCRLRAGTFSSVKKLVLIK